MTTAVITPAHIARVQHHIDTDELFSIITDFTAEELTPELATEIAAMYVEARRKDYREQMNDLSWKSESKAYYRRLATEAYFAAREAFADNPANVLHMILSCDFAASVGEARRNIERRRQEALAAA